MKRWALLQGNLCVNVVEQEDDLPAPDVLGEWKDVTDIFMGPGYLWDGAEWKEPPTPQPQEN